MTVPKILTIIIGLQRKPQTRWPCPAAESAGPAEEPDLGPGPQHPSIVAVQPLICLPGVLSTCPPHTETLARAGPPESNHPSPAQPQPQSLPPSRMTRGGL